MKMGDRIGYSAVWWWWSRASELLMETFGQMSMDIMEFMGVVVSRRVAQ